MRAWPLPPPSPHLTRPARATAATTSTTACRRCLFNGQAFPPGRGALLLGGGLGDSYGGAFGQQVRAVAVPAWAPPDTLFGYEPVRCSGPPGMPPPPPPPPPPHTPHGPNKRPERAPTR